MMDEAQVVNREGEMLGRIGEVVREPIGLGSGEEYLVDFDDFRVPFMEDPTEGEAEKPERAIIGFGFEEAEATLGHVEDMAEGEGERIDATDPEAAVVKAQAIVCQSAAMWRSEASKEEGAEEAGEEDAGEGEADETIED